MQFLFLNKERNKTSYFFEGTRKDGASWSREVYHSARYRKPTSEDRAQRGIHFTNFHTPIVHGFGTDVEFFSNIRHFLVTYSLYKAAMAFARPPKLVLFEEKNSGAEHLILILLSTNFLIQAVLDIRRDWSQLISSIYWKGRRSENFQYPSLIPRYASFLVTYIEIWVVI